jgi:hypothetical protein
VLRTGITVGLLNTMRDGSYLHRTLPRLPSSDLERG